MEGEVEEATSITEADAANAWREALGIQGRFVPDGPDVLTFTQIAELMRCYGGTDSIRAHITASVEAGTIEEVKVRRMYANGRRQVINAYRIR